MIKYLGHFNIEQIYILYWNDKLTKVDSNHSAPNLQSSLRSLVRKLATFCKIWELSARGQIQDYTNWIIFDFIEPC